MRQTPYRNLPSSAEGKQKDKRKSIETKAGVSLNHEKIESLVNDTNISRIMADTKEGSTSPKLSRKTMKKNTQKKMVRTKSEEKRANVIGTFFNRIMAVGRAGSPKPVEKLTEHIEVIFLEK